MTLSFFWLKNSVFRRHAIAEYKSALENILKSENDLHEINFQKRKSLLQFAYNNSSFYKEFYAQNNIHPDDIKQASDWKKVPVLEKHHIQNNPSLQISFDKKKLIRTTTGGSTGNPMKTFRDKSFPEEIIKWRMLKRWNISPATDVAQFWRIPKACNTFSYKIKNKLIWWPTIRLAVDASFLTEEKFYDITTRINKVKPKMFWGYVGALEQYAVFLKKNEIKISKPKCLWVTAAPVSKIQKTLFAEVISENILDQYACSEIHWVASNVPETDNLIIDYDYRHVDIVDNQDLPCESNEIGDILLTDLENYVFPLIKYRVGDKSMFVKERSKYAPNFPMMAPVKGRISDYIKTKNGIILNGEYLTTIFDHQSNVIQQFQIHQIDIESVKINIVLNNNCQQHQIDNKVVEELNITT